MTAATCTASSGRTGYRPYIRSCLQAASLARRRLLVGGRGVCFDSTSQNAVAQNNLVYRTSNPSVHQNDGFNNTVNNNILAHGNLGIIGRTHNIMLWDINSAQGSFQRGI